MRTSIATGFLVLCAAAACTGGGPAATQQVAQGTTHAGWYMQNGGQGFFQSCGQERQVRITDSADLEERARRFGLQPDTPVYVQLRGTQSASGDALAVARVEQFGSDKPVRNCGLNGVVKRAPPTSGE